MRTVFLTFFILSVISEAKSIRIASIYSTSNQIGNFAFGLEAACMTRAVLSDAKKHGLKISFKEFDLEYDAIKSGLVAKTVVQEGYDIAIGTLTTAEALAAAPIFEQGKVPFVVPTASNPEVTRGKKYVTRISFNDARQAYLLAKLTAVDLHPKSVAVIRNVSSPYSDFLGKEYLKSLQMLVPDMKVTDYPIIDGVGDASSLIQKIVAQKADLIFVPLLQSTIASFYSELARRNAHVTLLGSDIVESDVNFVQTLGHVSPFIRFVFVQHWDKEYKGPYAGKFKELLKRYCSQFRPSMVLAAGFDSTMLLVEALKRLPHFSKELLVPAMRSTSFIGVTGPMIYGQDGDPLKPLQMFIVEQGNTRFWKEFQ